MAEGREVSTRDRQRGGVLWSDQTFVLSEAVEQDAPGSVGRGSAAMRGRGATATRKGRDRLGQVERGCREGGER